MIEFIIGLIVVIIIVVYYFYYTATPATAPEQFYDEPVIPEKSPEDIEIDWNTAIMNKNIEDGVKKSHNKYVSNVRQYSSGSNFTSVADDNISGIYTNWQGFSKPSYVEVGPGARTVPDIDTEVLKRNKRLTFVNSYGF